jgi:hypothetical protein
MSRMFLALVGLLAATMIALPATAAAEPPSNDDVAAATVIASLPFIDSADLTEATGGPGEPQTCSQLSQSVWYSITPLTDETIHADAFGLSAFKTEVDVYRQDGPGTDGLTALDCGSYGSSLDIPLEAGKTYYIETGNAWGYGGTLQVNVEVMPTPADVGGAPSVASPFTDPTKGTWFDANGTFLLAGQPIFPIVLAKPPPFDGTTPSGADALDEVVTAGVNLFKVGPPGPGEPPYRWQTWTDAAIENAKAWDAAALARGAHTWINLDTISRAIPGKPSETLLRKVVTSLLGDVSARGIGLWKGADEPWWGHYPPSILQFPYCFVTGRGDPSWCAGREPLDGSHAWVTIEAPRGTADDLSPYSAVTDTHGVDIYPVGGRIADPDLHQVGTWTQTVESITPNHSVWTTLQICFSGSSVPTGGYVLPTRLQERFMIYDSIINGARGLAFYGGNFTRCQTASDQALGWNWTFWNDVLADLVMEVNADSPLASVLVNPASTHRPTSSDPTTEVISRHARGSNDLWVIAARYGAGTADVTISGLPRAITSGDVYTEGRSVSVKDGSFTDSFDRWGVHVYRFSPTGG